MSSARHNAQEDGEVIVVFGGRSEIGLSVAERLAPGRIVVLAARAGSDLTLQRRALKHAGAAEVATVDFDADAVENHADVVDSIETVHGPIEIAVLAFGILGDQQRAEYDSADTARILHTDFVAQAALLVELSTRMRARRSGVLVAFSSVAGIRVRRANFVYGSAKAGLDGFATGLADALHGSGVTLVIPRPGFVIGRMTEGMSPAPFSSTPAQVADVVVERITARKPGAVWIPWQLRILYMIARVVPQWLWRRAPR